jgi:addiction module RelE/StbE family toxin
MWTVFEAHKAVKHIDRLPKHVLEKYEFWKSVAQISGPDGLRKFPGFRDHPLKGEWHGHRSSYLNDSFRVIYWIDGRAIRVNVVDVTHHDYRRK